MNKFTFLLASIIGFSASSFSQSTLDTVSLGAGYANEAWYELSTGTTTHAPRTEWDIAFSSDGFSSSIHFNNAIGKIWAYPNGSNAAWSSVDTAGITTWPELYNSPTSWESGAFDQNYNPNIDFDYGWGVYNMTTHFVTGDSLFVVKLANGTYKKLDIINLANGSFNFRYSNLDNSNEETRAFVKSNYSTKLFGYYSIQNDEFLDREPLKANWDLMFKQYYDYIPYTYFVSGILVSPNWTVAGATGIIDPSTYTNYSAATFGEEINTIGSQWKTFNMGTFSYDIADDIVFFLQNDAGDIWKVIPTGFGGSANGNFIFTKEQLAFAGLNSADQEQFVNVYPNPATDKLVVTFDSKSSETSVQIINTFGQVVLTESFASSQGLTQKELNINELNSGIYFLTIQQNGATTTKRIVKQ